MTKPAASLFPPPSVDPLAYQQWLDEIVSLDEGAQLRGVAKSTLKRDETKRGRVLDLSERRKGIRRRHALLMD